MTNMQEALTFIRTRPRTWREAALILLLSLLGFLGSTLFHSPGSLLVPAPTSKLVEPTPVDLALAEVLIAEGQALPVDARVREAWESGHLPNAISIPLMEAMDPDYSWPRIQPGQTLLVYCSGPTCYDARDLCQVLAQKGFTRLLLFEGGWEAWSTRLPTQGEQP